MIGHKHIPSREGGIEVVVEELSTRMVKLGHSVTCFNRKGRHVSGGEIEKLKEYKGVKIKEVFTIERKGLAAMTSSLFATLSASFSNYEVIHIHAEGPAFFSFIPHLLHKKIVVTIHGLDWDRAKWSIFAKWYIKQVLDFNHMFKRCSKLSCNISSWKFNKKARISNMNDSAEGVKLPS